jgi:hypothetical protein
VVDASTLSTTSIASFPGSGGGGGNMGGWPSVGYSGIAGTGGAGGGALAIICQGTINLNSGSIVDARGGDGNPPGDAYVMQYGQSAGGGGSGGTFYVAGANVNVSAVTIGEGASANGATIDLSGGRGGGWRNPRTGLMNRYPWYNSHGNFGGDGGYGRMVVEYRTSLNGGKELANRWGYEQSTFPAADDQYRALAGTATFKCRGVPAGSYFRSKFVDLGSLRPQVTALYPQTQSNVASLVLQGQGAQSHPHNPGAGGTGEADSSNLGTLTSASFSMYYDGWRWWRFQGSFTRFSTGGAPVIDNIQSNYDRDNTP